MDREEMARKLLAPFEGEDLEWRIQSAGKSQSTGKLWAKVVPYITARAVADRLTEVFGVLGWKESYREVVLNHKPGNPPVVGMICRLEAWDGEKWIPREDAAELTDIEPLKGGISDAFKRAAVKWGIGRDLYRIDTQWANIGPRGPHHPLAGKLPGKGGDKFWWAPPKIRWPGQSGQPKTPPPNANFSHPSPGPLKPDPSVGPGPPPASEDKSEGKGKREGQARTLSGDELAAAVRQCLGAGDRARAWNGVRANVAANAGNSKVGPITDAQWRRIYKWSTLSADSIHDEVHEELSGMSTRNVPWTAYAALVVLFGADKS